MKFLSKLLLLPALLAALVVPAHATLTLTFEAENLLQGGNGSLNVAANSLVLVVADTGNNGFSTLGAGNIAVGATIGTGSTDLIVGQLAVSAAGIGTNGENVLEATLNGGPTPYFGSWAAGQPLAIYWIPSLNFGDTNIGNSVAYGMYTNATDHSGTGGSPAWVTPSDGGTQTFFFSTTGVFSTITDPASAGYASFSTPSAVPEPSTFALLGGLTALGVTGFLRRRKTAQA
ncbi:MAG TPA: PEP-CTERM sorting domain-containing protein [Opitutales bacterium]|nr:PEP-CTERM sorting domain-containing protein [Opitutales bacterium]